MTAVEFELMVAYMAEGGRALSEQDKERARWLINHVPHQDYNKAYYIAFNVPKNKQYARLNKACFAYRDKP
jgi:hypothetical protein